MEAFQKALSILVVEDDSGRLSASRYRPSSRHNHIGL